MKTKLMLAVFVGTFILCCGNALANRCTDDSSLIATFAGVTGQAPYSITSDGMGSYSTTKAKGSTANVSFLICNGSNDLSIDLASSNRTVKVFLPGGVASSSTVSFDRIANIPVTEDSAGFAAFCGGRNPDNSIILDTPNTATADNYGGCGLDADGYFVRRMATFTLTSGRSLKLQTSPFEGDNLAAGTSYVKVYHPTGSTWTLSAENVPFGTGYHCGVNGSCAAVVYKPNNGAAYVEGYTIGRFSLAVSSTKIYL